MLTIDDINSINEKYKDIGFWYTIDLTKIRKGVSTHYDVLEIIQGPNDDNYYIKMKNNLYSGLSYLSSNGRILPDMLYKYTGPEYDYMTGVTLPAPDKIHLYFTKDSVVDIDNKFTPTSHLITPKISLQVSVINGEFDDKFYINVIGSAIRGYVINGEDVELESDENGYFLRLPSAEDSIIGVKSNSKTYSLYKVVFKEFKSLPLLSLPMMYASNKQEVKLLNSETGEYITDFQAYYKGELLVDNMLNVPSVLEVENGYIPITIDLLDNRYPNSTLKMKIPIKLYICRSQQEVETALENGITYFSIRKTTINGLAFDNYSIALWDVRFANCSFNNCETKWRGDNYDDGNNIFNNTSLRGSGLVTLDNALFDIGATSSFNNCSAENVAFRRSELYFTGTIKDCRIYETVIISDGGIEITGTEFRPRQTRKSYFPAFLYLTGDYIVTNNTFRMTATFTELSFNMCLIKATTDFNVGDFINKNTFNLNITYGEEPTSTLYYNIVDDDKIRARRL